MTKYNLVPEQAKILQLKYQSKAVFAMTPEELDLWGDALLLKIHVITGWSIPASKELMTILCDQFKKKMQESYSTCNPDEIEYAMRMKGTTIKDWGKNMNLSMIDEVMRSYLSERSEVSQIEEERIHRKELPAEQITEDEVVEYSFGIWKHLRRYEFIADRCYDILEKQGKIKLTTEEKKGFMKASKARLKERVASDPNFLTAGNEKSYQVLFAKKIAVEEYFKTLL